MPGAQNQRREVERPVARSLRTDGGPAALFERVHAGAGGQQSLVPYLVLPALLPKRRRNPGIQAYPTFWASGDILQFCACACASCICFDGHSIFPGV